MFKRHPQPNSPSLWEGRRRGTSGRGGQLRLLLFFAATAHCLVPSAFSADAVDDGTRTFITRHCIACHDKDTASGDFVFDAAIFDWSNESSAQQWTRIYDIVRSGDMPPPGEEQPTLEAREAFLNSLDKTLTKNVSPGGTVLRRLNREEYENTVRDVLGIPFSVPNSFPADTESHGFDNIGEGLVLSPPLMAQYVDLATAAADMILPPVRKVVTVSPQVFEIGPGDFTLNFTTGHEIDGVLRMANSSDPLARGSVWPNRFEARVGGIYDVEVTLSAFKLKEGHVPVVQLLAHKASGSAYTRASTLQKLAEFRIPSEKPQEFHAEVELERGQTVVIHYDNAATSSDKTDNVQYLERISGQLVEAFREDPELGAAWMKAGYQRSDRGWSWWNRIQKIRAEEDLDVASFDPDSADVKTFALKMARQGVNTTETMDCMNFFRGPAINIHGMSVAGPSRVIEDKAVIEQRRRTARFLGERSNRDDRKFASAVLHPVLDKLMRRPVTDTQLERYVSIAISHKDQGHRFEDGLHLAARAALCSPYFLFREYREGPMDDHDLAARLSYFLASSPPDATLRRLAQAGNLSDPEVLEQQTRRLLKHNKVKNFLDSFTGQWLDLRLLPQIMPDTRLLKWTSKDLQAVSSETRLFVGEILRENHSLETFIDPDFTYLNRRNAKLYGIKFGKSDKMKRVSLPRGGRRGGILTQASVLMATANGVDTQPVLRGAWMLENIFGLPTPPPPANVPAIEPDTHGARSIRELLDRHKADASCARCHRRIDPPGFVLENFDPVGRWRERYPIYKKEGAMVVTLNGQSVDATCKMPDGTPLKDVTDLKRYLVANIDIFSRCLTDKLLTYATGRPMNYGDRKVIDRIVTNVRQDGNGFADLIVAVVQSESFRAK